MTFAWPRWGSLRLVVETDFGARRSGGQKTLCQPVQATRRCTDARRKGFSHRIYPHGFALNRDLEVLGHAFGLFASWGMVTPEQARAVQSVPHLKEPPGRVRYLSPDEEARLLAKLSPCIRPIVLTALLSGMRESEVVMLAKDAVDLAAGMITLATTKANRVRRVYVNADLAAVLREAIARSPGSFVFANGKGERYTCDGVRVLFRRAVEKAGLDDFRFHDLRHTTATRLRRAGAGLDTVAAVLGHATLAMAARYAHIGSADLRAAMASLPAPAKPAAAEAVGQVMPFTSETRAG